MPLDLNNVIKASKTLSGEIVLSRLLDEKAPSTTAIPTRVLLVEDQEINIFGIQSYLANYGYEVSVA